MFSDLFVPIVKGFEASCPDGLMDITLDKDTFDEFVGELLHAAKSDEQKVHALEADKTGVVSLKQLIIKRGPKIYLDNIVPFTRGKK